MPIENMASPKLLLGEVNHDFRLAHTRAQQLPFVLDLNVLAAIRIACIGTDTRSHSAVSHMYILCLHFSEALSAILFKHL